LPSADYEGWCWDFLHQLKSKEIAEMRKYIATVTSKGQLTLPAAVRRDPGIEPGDRVAIVIEDEEGTRLRRIEHDVRSVRGLITTPPGLERRDFEEMIAEAMADHADQMLGRLGEEPR
jgi:antitoxin PrlF